MCIRRLLLWQYMLVSFTTTTTTASACSARRVWLRSVQGGRSLWPVAGSTGGRHAVVLPDNVVNLLPARPPARARARASLHPDVCACGAGVLTSRVFCLLTRRGAACGGRQSREPNVPVVQEHPRHTRNHSEGWFAGPRHFPSHCSWAATLLCFVRARTMRLGVVCFDQLQPTLVFCLRAPTPPPVRALCQ